MNPALFLATIAHLMALQTQSTSTEPPVLERFATLTNLQKASVLRRIERRLLWIPNPGIERIRRLGTISADLPRASEALPVDANSPVQVVIDTGSEMHLALRRDYPEVPIMPRLHRAVGYDWYGGEIVQLRPLSYAQVFANYLSGFPPGSDRAMAQLIARIDAQTAPDLRPIARWFAHRYVSREGQVYLGVTQFEMWHSSTKKMLTIEDHEAIRFARTVLGNEAYRAPLTANAARTDLYKKMAESFGRYRRHRSTCEALAAAMISATPEVEPVAKLLIPRMLYLLAAHNDSVPEVLSELAAHDRDGLVAKIDGKLADVKSGASIILDFRRKELEAMAKAVSGVAREVLAAVESEGESKGK